MKFRVINVAQCDLIILLFKYEEPQTRARIKEQANFIFMPVTARSYRYG
jgi:hypothetical protein